MRQPSKPVGFPEGSRGATLSGPGSKPESGPGRSPDRTRGLVADSRTVALWTLVSRITGFCRVATIGAVLGPTYFGNIFQTAVLLPSIIFALLGGSLVGAILVPPLVRLADSGDVAALRRLAGGFFGVLMLVLLCVVVLTVLGAPLLLLLATAAVENPVVRQQQHEVGLTLLFLLLPQILLYGTGALAMAVQHAHGRFAVAAAAPVLENVGGILVLAMSATLFGVGPEVGAATGSITTPHLLLLGLGTTGAVALHAATQWWGAWRVGVTLVPKAGWRDPEVRKLLRLAFTSSGYTGLYNLVFFGVLVAAGGIPGGVVAFQIGHNFLSLPVSLTAVPLASAQLPRLSRSFNDHDSAGFSTTFRKSVALTRFVTLPAGLLLFIMSETLARAVAFGQMAASDGVAMIAACIGGLGLGVIGEASMVVATSASYARRNGWVPLRAMALRAGIALLGVLAATNMVGGVAVLWTLGLTVSAANLAASAYQVRCVTRTLPSAQGGWSDRLLGEFLASALSVAVGASLALWLGSDAGSHLQKVGVALAAVAVSGAVYLTAQWLRGSGELRAILAEFLGPGSRLRCPQPQGEAPESGQ